MRSGTMNRTSFRATIRMNVFDMDRRRKLAITLIACIGAYRDHSYLPPLFLPKQSICLRTLLSGTVSLSVLFSAHGECHKGARSAELFVSSREATIVVGYTFCFWRHSVSSYSFKVRDGGKLSSAPATLAKPVQRTICRHLGL
jgi:hypothetical protein